MDAKKKSDEPGDDTDVFTQKHSENLFQRTEVLAGEAVFAKLYLTRNKTQRICIKQCKLNTWVFLAYSYY